MEENSSEGEAEYMEAVESNDREPDHGDGGTATEPDSNGGEEEQQFDITLAAYHTYMGSKMATVAGRRVLEAGWTGRVAAWAHHGAVFPGETVPVLRADMHLSADAPVLHAIHTDKMFGLLCPDETGTILSGYGVLCEVFEADAEDEREGGLEPARAFKALAAYRFKVVDLPKQPEPVHVYERIRLLQVRVLPEIAPTDALRPARLLSLDARRTGTTQLDKRLRSMDAALTPWPLFVYDIFDYARMRRYIADYFLQFNLTRLPQDAVSLSCWVAANLSLAPRDRLALFVVDHALLRLRMEVQLIARRSALCCSACKTEIARREHIIAMSSDGVHSNYTNLGGFIHDIVTVSRADNVELEGAASAEYSWFPGYSWTIALCAACAQHVGWRFDALGRKLRPARFFGLCRNTVRPRAGELDAAPDL